MQPAKRIVIVAGEESGDIHAAAFVRELLVTHPNLQITGIGGRHMRAAGVNLISDLAQYGVTGVSEVIRHLSVIKQAFNTIKAHLTANKPDLLILVDYPGFNLRLAKFAKETLGIRIVYYISPQIWAWKAGRIHAIRRYIDHMAVILPFEKRLYEQAGVPVSFVGHPLVDKVRPCVDITTARNALNLPTHKRVIAMLPGSRTHEIERHMPVLRDTAVALTRQYPDLHFAIPVAGTIKPELVASFFASTAISYTLIAGKAVEAVACSDCVVVASGTASLECALLEKPMCIIYKASTLTYMAAFKFIKIKFLGLCNLLQNEMIAPELLQYDCNPIELTRVLSELLHDQAISQRMVKRLHQLRLSLSTQQADCTISALIVNEFNHRAIGTGINLTTTL